MLDFTLSSPHTNSYCRSRGRNLIMMEINRLRMSVLLLYILSRILVHARK